MQAKMALPLEKFVFTFYAGNSSNGTRNSLNATFLDEISTASDTKITVENQDGKFNLNAPY